MEKPLFFFVRVKGRLSPETHERLTRYRLGVQQGSMGWRRERREEEGLTRWEDLDSDGVPFFRVLIAAKTDGEARATVERVLDGLKDEIEVVSVDRRAPGSPLEGSYDEIGRRAFEHLTVELMSGYAAEQERLDRLKNGREPAITLTFRMRGTYPETRVQIQSYERARDLDQTSEFALWAREEFVAAYEEGDLVALRRWIGDELMYARGG